MGLLAVLSVLTALLAQALHTHRYDLVGISYQECDRIITQGSAPGRLVNTKPWVGYCCFSQDTSHTATASFSRSFVVPGLGKGGGSSARQRVDRAFDAVVKVLMEK
jgi:hypothetical protein